MAIVPILRCRTMEEAVAFYTGVLDFTLAGAWPPDGAPAYAILRRGDDELHLSSLEGVPGQAVNIFVPDVDALFGAFLARGLEPSAKPGSPVHQGPTDQTWGTREFYVDDPSGNTLRFTQRQASQRPVA